jgi:hypothetical protein
MEMDDAAENARHDVDSRQHADGGPCRHLGDEGYAASNGHERSMAAKHADARKCGAARGGQSFNDAAAPNMQQCMLARGWVLDHVIPDQVTRHARRSNDDDAPPVDNSSNDDWVRRQQDQDNLQQMLNTQQMINDQQMQNNQQQQQIIDDMNR